MQKTTDPTITTKVRPEIISVDTPRERLAELIELSRAEIRKYPKSMGALSYFMSLLQIRDSQDARKGKKK